MHSFRVVRKNGEPTRVYLDGVDITNSCFGYEISSGPGSAGVKLELACDELDIEEDNPVLTIQTRLMR